MSVAGTYILQVSAGAGPREARAFVALLAARLEAECRARGLVVRAVIAHGDPGSPRSVEITVAGEAQRALAGELGTHALVARGEARGRAARKRWFAGVSVHAATDAMQAHKLRASDVQVTATRAGGPGGQNVNKVSSAVRVLHVASGIAVRAAEERSRRANLARALARIDAQLAARAKAAAARGDASRRGAHHRVERGAPVREYRLTGDGALEVIGARRD